MPVHTGPCSDARSSPWAVAVADINWFTTESLFREHEVDDVTLLGLRCMDYLNGWRKGLTPWSPSCRPHPWAGRSIAQDMVLPSGWMKRFPTLGMRPIARAVRRFWRGRREEHRGLILTYPHYLHLLRKLDAERSLYFNLDDYALYWPRQADRVRELEAALVHAADVTVCVSAHRARCLRSAWPGLAGRIHHIPHGTPSAFLSPAPNHRPAAAPDDLAALPRPRLGYVGSIESRVDWKLMDRLAKAFPHASIVVVGSIPPPRESEPWYRDWAAFASRPNVHAIGWRSQAQLPAYYRSFDVILIPYLTTHPFNEACSPTKIADGLGAGRPIVATAIPECRLYDHLFDVAEDADGFLEAVARIVSNDSDDGRSAARHHHARINSCTVNAGRLLQLLTGGTSPSSTRNPMASQAPAR
ncbi:Putative teichuronic acid biosynthesis glycosyltransferase TuaH [Aquisphaera giovannonii]|uniref:Teichuronic acid biosynthesis glycosyltransferase TuaH n=1 Tax=Aquisphaera giovannonii TaxID=406548 RepID=A0A5B9VZ93_9BACT|nr:glycosyltransferase [Aquisphaera giovannonii]QEH33672.1 Putative teichuronic acid biosynthesis glycosyltransferase TuaH [Aquisphaera giovannonii]